MCCSAWRAGAAFLINDLPRVGTHGRWLGIEPMWAAGIGAKQRSGSLWSANGKVDRIMSRGIEGFRLSHDRGTITDTVRSVVRSLVRKVDGTIIGPRGWVVRSLIPRIDGTITGPKGRWFRPQSHQRDDWPIKGGFTTTRLAVGLCDVLREKERLVKVQGW